MHLTTILFFSLLAFFAWRGYQKGFIKSITSILSWIVAYPAAIFFTPTVAKWLTTNTPLKGFLVYFVAGCGIFLIVSWVVSALLNLIARLIPDNHLTNTGSKIGGTGVGILMGAFVGLIVVYLTSIFLNVRPTIPASTDTTPEVVEEAGPAPDTSLSITKVPALKDVQKERDSFIEASAKKLIGNAAATAADLVFEDKTTTQITRAFVEDPHTMLNHVQQVSRDGDLQKLMADENVQSIMTTGDTQALMRSPSFQALMKNPSVSALMSESSVHGEEGSRAAAEKMIAAWNRVQLIKHDPRIIAIISDPEFQQQLQSPNKLPLMMNPKLNQLTEIIFSKETIPANGMSQYNVRDIDQLDTTHETNTLPPDDSTKAQPTIYRWTDKDGQVHYSDRPIKDNQ